MTEKDFIPHPDSYREYSNQLKNGSFTWSSPSNIALVKYWGKRDNQIPENPSISFTLNDCKTTTILTFSKKDNDGNLFKNEAADLMYHYLILLKAKGFELKDIEDVLKGRVKK